ncbi:MAG: molybdenum cofactor guanylyltransferase [Tissierellia bacterium]|nr:molybdenum cofactor guanylyltransferase [Tissierellia bacterium]
MKLDSAIILAGGKSSRMGFDKQLIEIDDMLIGEYIARELSMCFSEIIIVTNRPELYTGSNYKVIGDIYPGHGPISGIHAGLVESNSQYSYITACDMPIISKKYIETIIEIADDNFEFKGLVVGKGKETEPMNGVYSKSLISDLENRIVSGNYRIRSIIEDNEFIHIDKSILKEVEGDIFMNLNMPEDLNSIQNK